MANSKLLLGIAMAESVVILGIVGAFLAGYIDPIGLAIAIAVLGSVTGMLFFTMLKKPVDTDRQDEL